MKIALTGAPSTGKTTLIMHLIKESSFREFKLDFITADARSILKKLGFRSIDKMSKEQLRYFQLLYLDKKIVLEKKRDNFITDRSFVDVASFWLQRDTIDLDPDHQKQVLSKCKNNALVYDLHVYLPFGLFNFEPDGYRSIDIEQHKRVDSQILSLLKKWQLKYIALSTTNIKERISLVLNAIKKI